MSKDLDPLDALVDTTVNDPNPEPITDEADPDFVKPAANVKPRKRS